MIENRSLLDMTMLCHDGLLLVRHANAPDVPFQVFSKETLEQDPAQTPFGMAEGEEDTLKWTAQDLNFPSDTTEGNRHMRASPMFSDGEFIYFLVQYRQTNHESAIVKTVLETYSVQNRKLKRIAELPLFKNDNRDYFKGSRRSIDKGGYLARGSIACNGEILIFHSNKHMHFFDMSSGIRMKKEHINSTALITTYDAKTNFYFQMDAACYSWLKKCKIRGFKPRVLGLKKEKEMPQLPMVLDEQKKLILTQITNEKKEHEGEMTSSYSANTFEQLFKHGQ